MNAVAINIKMISAVALIAITGSYANPALSATSKGTSTSVRSVSGGTPITYLPRTSLAGLSSNGSALPVCNLDSFVHQAGANADQIYGDEGSDGLPPLYGLTQASRINAGIIGDRDQGLTTGHGSYLPNAWGADEFLAPANGEWSLAGTNNGNTQYNNGAAALDASDKTEEALNVPGSSGANNSSTCYSGAGGVSPNPLYPNAPGPGYYSIVGCGGDFQGWMDPGLVTIGQSNWGLALYDFYTSSEFIGDPLEAQYEISQIQASGSLNGG